MEIRIVKYKDSYYKKYNDIIRKLWNDVRQSDIDDIIKEITEKNNPVFLALHEEDIVGFVNASIRYDYVEGSESSPVGYIEGIYVENTVRKQGIANDLVNHTIMFFKSIGITEIGSDTEIDNHDSDQFHQKIGFTLSGINRHYIKKI